VKILGISAYYHDSAACLLDNGVLVAAAQEERFTRKRHDPAFPNLAIDYCLKTAGVTRDEVDVIAYYEKPFLKFERILEMLIENAPGSYPLAVRALPVWLKDKLWMKKTIRREFGRSVPVMFTGHHESHAASAFYPSPFREAATLTVDGVGEWSTTTWGIGRENSLTLKSEIRYPHSLGLLYSAVTQYLGFKVNSAEYKVMGLAPYGEPKYSSQIKNNLIEIFEDGSYLLNLDHFSFNKRSEMINSGFEKVFGRPRRNAESKLEPFHADVARSIQDVSEEVMLKLARHVHRETKLDNLCLAGGVALNCVANGKIVKQSPFKQVWIQPGAGDSGGAVGAAYLIWHQFHGAPRPQALGDHQQGSFLGPQFDDLEIESALKQYGMRHQKHSPKSMVQEAAKLLDEQQIVGWFQGRMEFGPRALGNRSIIGDARNPEMQKRMNLKIKFRESFRPFAPSVIAEDAAQYFDIDVISPYMLLTCGVAGGKIERRAVAGGENWMGDLLSSIPSRIPAVTHVDGSARVHTVERKTNALFFELLQAFKEKTKSSVLINTSFNVRGEPIVCTPNDAVRCFIKSDIDALVIGNFVVRRTEQTEENLTTLRKRFNEEDQFELD